MILDSVTSKSRELLLSLLLVLGAGLPAWGNAGPSDTGVKIAGEPTGIADVGIEHEALTIDLTPFAAGKPAKVEAVYKLNNKGPEQTLNLLFAFGTREQSNCIVTLDDQPITGELKRGTDMPTEWWPPETTPSLSEHGRPMRYAGGWSTVVPLAFAIVVPPGRSELRVRYEEHGKTTFARPTMFRQFAYILAPARSWADFGGLSATILVPDGWAVACSPDMKRDGAVLQGSFDNVPADSIAITLRPPYPAAYDWARQLRIPLIVGLLALGLAICWRLGGSGGRRDARLAAANQPASSKPAVNDFLRAVAISVLFGVLMLAVGLALTLGLEVVFSPNATELAIIRELRLSDGYGPILAVFAVILMSGAAVGVGFFAALVGSLVARRRSGKGQSPTAAANHVSAAS